MNFIVTKIGKILPTSILYLYQNVFGNCILFLLYIKEDILKFKPNNTVGILKSKMKVG
jgi:hypothetical protein